MDFQVHKKKKKCIAKYVAKTKLSVKILLFFERLFLIGAFGGSILYICFNILIPSWSMVTIRGERPKQYEVIFFTGAMILILFLCVWLLIRSFRKNISGMGIMSHTEEKLLLQNNKLLYSYRILHCSFSEQRIIFKIHLGDIADVFLDEKTMKLTIIGDVVKEYANLRKNGVLEILETEEYNKLVMYDYYNPSLAETLENNGIWLQIGKVPEGTELIS